jgi:hypothetical protein
MPLTETPRATARAVRAGPVRPRLAGRTTPAGRPGPQIQGVVGALAGRAGSAARDGAGRAGTGGAGT